MPLGIVPGSEVSTPSSGAPINGQAFREAALAPGRLAAALGQDAGDLFQDVSQKLQANRNAQTIFKADLAMRKQKDAFTAGLAKMPDEGTWLPAWKEQTDALREQVLSGKNVGPDVRRVLSQKLDVWEAATSAQIRTQALRKGVHDTREDAIADSTYAAHQGHIEDAKNILNAAVAHYAMSPADARKIGVRFPSIAAQAQADTAITSNPIKAPDLIQKFKGTIEPQVFVGIMHRAEEERNRAQASNLNDLAEQMDDSPDGTIDPKLLAQKVKAGEITQRGADGLLTRQKRKADENTKDDFNLGMMGAYDHKWADDKAPEATASQMKEDGAHLPPALRMRLYKEIDAQVNAAKKEGEKEEKPVERLTYDAMRSVGSKRITQMTEDAKTEGEIDGQRLEQAREFHQMQTWFEANPEATPEAAEEARQKIQAPRVTREARQALLTGADRDAAAWANSHPDDPRAAKIRERLGL